MKRLAEFASPQSGKGYVKIDEVLGQELTITDVEFREGDYGPYCVFQANDEVGNVYTVASGSAKVVEALTKAVEAEALPVSARFAKRGKQTLIL